MRSASRRKRAWVAILRRRFRRGFPPAKPHRSYLNFEMEALPADSKTGHPIEHKEGRGLLSKWGNDLQQSYRTLAQAAGVLELDILPFDEPLATGRERWIHHARAITNRSLAEPGTYADGGIKFRSCTTALVADSARNIQENFDIYTPTHR